MNRFTLAAILLLSLTSLAFGQDGILEYQKICESEEALAAKGEGGSCQLLFVPKPAENMSGICLGQLKTLTCSLKFGVLSVGSAMVMNCGDKDMELDSEAKSFRIGAVVKNADGKKSFISDDQEHVTIHSEIVTLKFTKVGDEVSSPAIELNFGLGGAAMTNVSCF